VLDLTRLATIEGAREALELIAAREGARLRSPALDQALSAAEVELGGQLPRPIRRLYLAADGWDGPDPDFQFLPLAEARGLWRDHGWRAGALPFVHVGDGDYLAVCADGRVDFLPSDNTAELFAPSVEAWLAGELLHPNPRREDGEHDDSDAIGSVPGPPAELGAGSIEMPSLMGLTIEEARECLEVHRLSLGEVVDADPEAGPRVVVAQAPAPRRLVSRQWAVRVTLGRADPRTTTEPTTTPHDDPGRGRASCPWWKLW
jgi:hypothetical protein